MFYGNRLLNGIAGVAATIRYRVASRDYNRAGAAHRITVVHRHVLRRAAVADGEARCLKLGHGRHCRSIIHGTTAHLFCCQCARDGRRHIVINSISVGPCRGKVCTILVRVGVGLRAFAVLLARFPSHRLRRVSERRKFIVALVFDDRQRGRCRGLGKASHTAGRCHRVADLCGIYGVLYGNRLLDGIAGVAATVCHRVASGHHERAGAAHCITVAHRHALCGAAVADAEARGHKFGHGRHRRRCRSRCATANLNRSQRAREGRGYIVVDVVGEHPCLGLICTILIGVRVLLRTFAVLLARLPCHRLRRISDRRKRVAALVFDDRQSSRCRGLRKAGHIAGRCHRTADL